MPTALQSVDKRIRYRGILLPIICLYRVLSELGKRARFRAYSFPQALISYSSFRILLLSQFSTRPREWRRFPLQCLSRVKPPTPRSYMKKKRHIWTFLLVRALLTFFHKRHRLRFTGRFHNPLDDRAFGHGDSLSRNGTGDTGRVGDFNFSSRLDVALEAA